MQKIIIEGDSFRKKTDPGDVKSMRRKLGEILLENGAISVDDLDLALEIQKQPDKRQRLGEILMQRGAVTESTLQKALAEQGKAE